MTYLERVAAARRVVREETTADLAARRERPVLVDVREPAEHAAGTIPGSVSIPLGVLERITEAVPDKDAEVVVFCAIGNRSALAAAALQEEGYRRVSSLAGGYEAWRREGREVHAPEGATMARYARHLVLPGLGAEGQRRLLGSSVLVVGAGGLGSPAALYLAAAGVGKIGIIDDDVVDLSNLQRQVIHDTERLGAPKSDSAATSIRRLNPEVEVVEHRTRLSAGNALDVMGRYDVVVDGADNFPTRYLINDASLHLGVPVVHASVFRWEGQVSVFLPWEGPCYRCLYPEPPPPELAPNCEAAGVLGALPGVVGSVQAVEAIKVLLGATEPLVGRLFVYDALAADATTLRFRRNPVCAACCDESRPPVLVDYDAACSPVDR